MRYRIALALLFTLVSATFVKADCLRDATEFATKICGEIQTSGEQTVVDGKGDLKASIGSIIRRVLGNGSAEISVEAGKSTFENVLHEQLGQTIFNVLECRQKMVRYAGEQLCGKQPACTQSRILKSVSLPTQYTQDGVNNVIGQVNGINISIIQDCVGGAFGPDRYYFTYGFFNGAGTQGGSQTMTLTFRSANGGTVDTANIPLDRGHCVYGASEARSSQGALGGVGSLVTSIELSITRLAGTQNRC